MRKRTPLLFLSIAVAAVAAEATFGWVTIRRGFSARGNPSALEAYFAKTARGLSIPASDRDAKNPFAPTADVLGKADEADTINLGPGQRYDVIWPARREMVHSLPHPAPHGKRQRRRKGEEEH